MSSSVLVRNTYTQRHPVPPRFITGQWASLHRSQASPFRRGGRGQTVSSGHEREEPPVDATRRLISPSEEEEEEGESRTRGTRSRPSSDRFKLDQSFNFYSHAWRNNVSFRATNGSTMVRINLMEYRRKNFRNGAWWFQAGFSTWHEANFFNSENYIIGQLRVRRVRRKRSRWRMIESCARVGNFIVLLEPSDWGESIWRVNRRHSFDDPILDRVNLGGSCRK